MRKPGYPLAQLIRRLGETRIAFVHSTGTGASSTLTKQEHHDGSLPSNYEGATQFFQLITVHYKLNIRQSADCHVLIKDIRPVVVTNILLLAGALHIVYKKFKHVTDLFDCPLSSSNLGIYKVAGCLKQISVAPVCDILAKFVFVPLGDQGDVVNDKLQHAIIPILHSVAGEHD